MEVVHGNRGKCAQGCRLPYTLLENEKEIDKGYLLSPKDLCSLALLPSLVKAGVNSFKIEGRMKTPEYVATVTRIYRKYLDKILKDEPYVIEKQDKKDLLQVFNRGGFSTGHLENKPNLDLIFPEKPNNMGIYIGNVSKYQATKGHITLQLNESIGVGDTISFENENSKYTISELMQGNQNLGTANAGTKVTIGRMKGNIKVGDKIYKLASKQLQNDVKQLIKTENKKQALQAVLDVHLDEPITLKIFDNANHVIEVKSDEMPDVAIHSPITKERLENQLNKLTDTPFYFKNIQIRLDNNLFIPHISTINELRRKSLEQYTNLITNSFKRKNSQTFTMNHNDIEKKETKHQFCLLLNTLNTSFDYTQLTNVDKLYIPLKYFYLKEYQKLLHTLSQHFSLYIYLPNILKTNFQNVLKETIDNALKEYSIKGFVVSNMGYFDLLKEYQKNYEWIGNYTLNIFNDTTANAYPVHAITISPELNKEEINQIANQSKIATEYIVYGNLPLMTSSYCPLGKSNKCYPECKQKCKQEKTYYLKDRMGFLFRMIPDNLQTVTTIYNSKITSIAPEEINQVNNYRINILDETIEEINQIIQTVKERKRMEGKDYTNGNFHRVV